MNLSNILPQNVEAEGCILGSCMLDNEACAVAVEMLPDSAAFYLNSHRVIYDSILDLSKHDRTVDIITVSNSLKERKKLEDCGGTDYLVKMLNVMPSTGNVKYYAEIIKEKYIRRQAIYAAMNIRQWAEDEEMPVEEVLQKTDQAIFEIGSKDQVEKAQQIGDSVEEAYKNAMNHQNPNRIKSHFANLQYITGGHYNSSLEIWAARPSMGKTALLLNEAMGYCEDCNEDGIKPSPILIYSFEMSRLSLVIRMLASEARIDSRRIKDGYVTPAEIHRLHAAATKIHKYPIWIDDKGGQSIYEVRSKTRRFAKAHGVPIVAVDHLQLFQMPNKNRNTEIGEITMSLKNMAKELNTPVICLSQLSRKVEDRSDKRPILPDLRESGNIEQDADTVLFIYRDGYYTQKHNEPNETEAEIIVSKGRDGGLGMAKLKFTKDITKFEEA